MLASDSGPNSVGKAASIGFGRIVCFCLFNFVNESIVKCACDQLSDGFLVSLEMYTFSVFL